MIFSNVARSVAQQDTLTQKPHTVACQWIDALIEGVKKDGQGPTVHARNIFHLSAAIYDAWAMYEGEAETYLMSNSLDGFESKPIEFTPNCENLDSAQEVTICYAAFRLLEKRFSIMGLRIGYSTFFMI